MLKITDYNATDFTKGISIDEAYDVRLCEEINGARTLELKYPLNEKSCLIEENKIILCRGQGYRVMRTTLSRGDENYIAARCEHIFNADAKRVHIQNIPDMIGVKPSAVIKKAIQGTGFKYYTDSELEAMGMTSVDRDGFLIDYFTTDKTNIYDVIKSVIDSSGKGEIYADNYNIALVERLGSDTKVRLDLSKNLCGVKVERDIEDMVTRLYPYGKDDLHIGSVMENGAQYIDSPNASRYGIKEGYRDYSEITKPQKLLSRAMWEFSDLNNERIDLPCLNITGTYVDLSRLIEYGAYENLSIGDGVMVVDGENKIYERVIKIEENPYDAEGKTLSIGRVKKDIYFYLEQMGAFTKLYKKTSTSKGKLRATSLMGTVKNGVSTDSVTSQQLFTSQINLGKNTLLADSEGNLLWNGVRLAKEAPAQDTEENNTEEGEMENNGNQ